MCVSTVGKSEPEREEPIVKFQIRKTSDGQFRFNLVARNGQVIATSETYSRKASALATIRSIQASAGAARVEDMTVQQAG